MQTYIVRVYRSNSDNNNDVAGIVEQAGTRQQHAFIGLSGLQQTLERFIKTDKSGTRLRDQSGSDEFIVNE